jgi:hypothetical protein
MKIQKAKKLQPGPATLQQEPAIKPRRSTPPKSARRPCQRHRYREQTTWSNAVVKRSDGDDEDLPQWHQAWRKNSHHHTNEGRPPAMSVEVNLVVRFRKV